MGEGVQGPQVCIWSIGFLGSSRERFGGEGTKMFCIIRQSGSKCDLGSHWVLVLQGGLKFLLFKGSSWLLEDDYSCSRMQPHYSGSSASLVGCWEWSAPYNSAVPGIQNDDGLRVKAGELWVSMGSVECTLVKIEQLSASKRKDSGSVSPGFRLTFLECLTV